MRREQHPKHGAHHEPGPDASPISLDEKLKREERFVHVDGHAVQHVPVRFGECLLTLAATEAQQSITMLTEPLAETHSGAEMTNSAITTLMPFRAARSIKMESPRFR